MYKIFINNTPVYLTDKEEKGNFPGDVQFIDNPGKDELKDIILQIESKEDGTPVVIKGKDLQKLKGRVFKNFKIIQAAGGVILNPDDDILLIYRKGLWDMPKGKFTKDEEPEEAALREVKEETGLKELHITKKIGYTYHSYFIKKKGKKKRVLKRTFWYEMKTAQVDGLKPEKREGITEAKWVRKDDLQKYLGESYNSLQDLLEGYFND